MPFYVDDPENPGKKADVLDIQRRDPFQDLPPYRLTAYLKRDSWTRREAILLLAGFSPDSTQWTETTEGLGQTQAGGIAYLDGTTDQQRSVENLPHPRTYENISDLQDLAVWARGAPLDERRTPSEWIEWAASKEFNPYWIDYTQCSPVPTNEPSASPKALPEVDPIEKAGNGFSHGSWQAEAWNIGYEWMLDIKNTTGKIKSQKAIANYVEGELTNRGIMGKRGHFLDENTIRREALKGITGRKPNGK